MIDLQLSDMMLSVDVNQDSLPPITVGLFRAFLAREKIGTDAYLIYSFLLYTYRWQHTDTVWATNEYIEKALRMGERRIRVAKSLLARMDLIATVREKNKKGRITKTFTRLNLLPNPGISTSAAGAPVDSDRPADRFRTGGPGPQMLEEEIKKSSASAQASPSQLPKTKNKTRAQLTPHGRLSRLFFELYHKRTGAERAPFNAACAKQLKNDIERIGEERLSRCLRSVFIEKRLSDEDRRLRLLKTCKGCGKQSETTGIDCPKCGEPDAFRKEAVNA
jgi:hypothetical protein